MQKGTSVRKFISPCEVAQMGEKARVEYMNSLPVEELGKLFAQLLTANLNNAGDKVVGN